MSTSTNSAIEIALYDADTDTLIQVLGPRDGNRRERSIYFKPGRRAAVNHTHLF